MEAIVTANVADLMRTLSKVRPEYLDLMSAITNDEFDAALIPFLRDAVEHLESNSKNFRGLDETGLTAAFVGRLFGFGLTVTQETNSNGHADFVIVGDLCSPKQKRIGEAKVYNGYAYHVSGLGQLLGYMSGREGGYLLSYVRKKDIKQLVDGLRSDMDTELPLSQQGSCADSRLQWSYCSVHVHACGENVKVTHIGLNLFVK